MEQNTSWEAGSCSAGQEIFHLLQNLKVHYHVHKSLTLVLSWSSWLHSIIILFSHLHLCLPSGFFPQGFLTKILYVFLISSTKKSLCVAPH